MNKHYYPIPKATNDPIFLFKSAVLVYYNHLFFYNSSTSQYECSLQSKLRKLSMPNVYSAIQLSYNQHTEKRFKQLF